MIHRLLAFAAAALALAGGALIVPSDAAAGGTCHRGSPITDERGTTVEMANNCFVATILRIGVGDTVTWVNTDDELHTVSGANESWGDSEDALAEGDAVSQTFTESGVYPYYCLLHPGMVGVIAAGDGQGQGASRLGSDGASIDEGGGGASLVSRDATDGSPNADLSANVAATTDDESSTSAALLIGVGGAALIAGALITAATFRARGHRATL